MAQEELIYINNDLRTMLIPDSFILGVQDDRLTHRIKFRLPRYYHGIDFSDGYRICVKYENALLEDDEAMIWPDDITVEETAIFFYWNPNRTAYMSDGWVNFCVTLTHVDPLHSGEEESADVLNQFSTAAHRVRVLKGIELDELIPEEIEKNIIVQAWEILTIAMERADAAKISEDNAKTSELNAKTSELNAAESERTAKEWELRSEAWAVGQRNGVSVPNNNETYHNNSKYWAEQSRDKTIFGNQTVFDAMNYVYPVGSIYMSTVNIDPAIIFGGSWQRIKSRFLFGCEDSGNYANGKTGGEATVTLGTDQIPSHKHIFTGNENTTTSVALTSNGPSTNTSGGTSLTTSGSRQANDTTKARTTVDAFAGYTSGPKNIDTNHTAKENVEQAGKLNTSYGGYWENANVWMNNKWVDSAGAYHISYSGNTGTYDSYTGKPLKPTSPYDRYDTTSDLGSSYRFTTSVSGTHKHSVASYTKSLNGKNVYPLSVLNDNPHDHVVTSYSSISTKEYVGNFDSEDSGNHNHTVSINHTHTFSHIHDMKHSHVMAHQHDIPDHQHSYQHYHYVPEHTHNMNHNHNFDHTHGMEHKHVIDSHTHSLSNHTHSINAHSHKVTPTGSISNTGGGQAHNNMPPYLCVYMWKRTALASNWS